MRDVTGACFLACLEVHGFPWRSRSLEVPWCSGVHWESWGPHSCHSWALGRLWGGRRRRNAGLVSRGAAPGAARGQPHGGRRAGDGANRGGSHVWRRAGRRRLWRVLRRHRDGRFGAHPHGGCHLRLSSPPAQGGTTASELPFVVVFSRASRVLLASTAGGVGQPLSFGSVLPVPAQAKLQ